MKNTILVTFSGTHGSGKSTNAARCYYLLNEAGVRFSYVRHQDLLDPFGFVLRRTARILHFKSTTQLERTRPVILLWSIYLLLIYMPVLVFGIRTRRLLGYNVVCDRYVYDLVAGFWGIGINLPVTGILSSMLPHPDVSFVLDAEESRILVDRPEHTVQYIRNEKKLYERVTDQFGLERVSTNDPPAIVWETMLAEIETVLPESATHTLHRRQVERSF